MCEVVASRHSLRDIHPRLGRSIRRRRVVSIDLPCAGRLLNLLAQVELSLLQDQCVALIRFGDRLQQSPCLDQQCLGGRPSIVGDRAPVSLAQVIQDAARTTKGISPSAQIEVEVPTDIAVLGTRDELAQVVQNLIDNAVKYSEAQGVVEVELTPQLTGDHAVARAGRLWESAGHMSIVSAAGRGPCVALRVTDAGPGIERQYLPRLSERFYRVDPGRGLRPGTGLGLAIVKHVVQRHRGSFLVESEPGRGSAFGVVLPMRRTGG